MEKIYIISFAFLISRIYVSTYQLGKLSQNLICNDTNTSGEYVIAVILPNSSDTFFSLNVVKPVLDFSVQTVNEDFMQIQNDYGRFNFSVEYIPMEGVTSCSLLETRVAYLASNWLEKVEKERTVIAWLGPGCSAGAQQLGHLTREWNVAWLDGSSVSSKLNNKTVYPTLIRTGWTMTRMAQFVEKVLEFYGWTNFALIYDDEDAVWSVFAKGIADYFKMKAVPNAETTYTDKYTDTVYYSFTQYLLPNDGRNNSARIQESICAAFNAIKIQARVVMFVGERSLVSEFLIAADRLGYNDNEWVFLIPSLPGFEVFSSPTTRSTKHQTNEANAVGRSLERVLVMSLQTNPSMESQLNSSYAMNYHIAMRMFSEALMESIVKGDKRCDGSALADRMRSRTILTKWLIRSNGGISFGNISVHFSTDENGDIRGDFALGAFIDPPRNFDSLPRTLFLFSATANDLYATNDVSSWFAAPNRPYCGYSGEACLPSGIIVTICVFCGLILVAIICFILYRRTSIRRLKEVIKYHEKWWEIRLEDIVLNGPAMNTFPRKLTSCKSFQRLPNPRKISMSCIQLGTLHGSPVCIKFVEKQFSLTTEFYTELKNIRDLQHENIIRIIGLCMTAPQQACVLEYCSRGPLTNLILNENIKLEWTFRYSLIADLIEGVTFLHRSAFAYHGVLTSFRCMIDSRFCLKVRKYSFKFLRKVENNPSRLLWSSPEVLRNGQQLDSVVSWRAADIYSIGIIMKEICTRTRPFGSPGVHYDDEPCCEDVINNVKKSALNGTPFRPCTRGLTQDNPMKVLVEKCWSEEPSARPTITQLVEQLKAIRRDSRGNMVDDLMLRLEKYANELESLVEERTKQFVEQKLKTEELLHELLPRSIAVQLMEEGKVPPIAYDCVTVYFSDIVSFTNISAESSPLEIVQLLNELFSAFDEIISDYDAYKVETVGDGYMVVSGLPNKNEDRHASEIAKLSLRILATVKDFTIPHRRHEKLQVRIGLHSGPCMAGVVGKRMPRYCLFGDTVNTASRMESTGLPDRIQMTSATASRLKASQIFEIEQRGHISVKGKGIMETYWLNGIKHEYCQISALQ